LFKSKFEITKLTRAKAQVGCVTFPRTTGATGVCGCALIVTEAETAGDTAVSRRSGVISSSRSSNQSVEEMDLHQRRWNDNIKCVQISLKL
jgi:hypothetical protein